MAYAVYMKCALIIVLVLFAGCSQWSIAADAALGADVASTIYMSDGGKWDRRVREGNPLLGTTPTVTALLSYMLVEWAFIGVADVGLPKSWKPWIFGTFAAGESIITVRNIDLARMPAYPGQEAGR